MRETERVRERERIREREIEREMQREIHILNSLILENSKSYNALYLALNFYFEVLIIVIMSNLLGAEWDHTGFLA